MSANERQRTKLQAMAFVIADAIREEFGQEAQVVLLVDIPEPAPDSMHELHFLGTVPPADSLTILRQAVAQCTDERGDCVHRATVHNVPN